MKSYKRLLILVIILSLGVFNAIGQSATTASKTVEIMNTPPGTVTPNLAANNEPAKGNNSSDSTSVNVEVPPLHTTTDTSISIDTSREEIIIPHAPIPPAARKVTMNFVRANMDQVFRFISQISGYSVVKPTDITGDITILSEKEISVDDAIDVLNSALATKGYTSVVSGNVLKIIPIENARESELPVRVGSNPERIKPGDEFITQVMPLNYADAVELKKDLATMLSKQGDMTANARSNTLIITGPSSNIHRLALIIKELDAPQSSVTQIRVFPLKNADATSLAKTLNDIFKSDATAAQPGAAGGNQPGQFFRQFLNNGGGGPGGRGGGAGNTPGGAAATTPEASTSRARTTVKITIDDRTNSLIISAPAADMAIIENLISQLDKDETEPEGTLVVHLQHGDAATLATMFNTLLQSSNTIGATQGGGGGNFLANLQRATQSAAAAKGGGSLLGAVKIAADKDTNSLLFITSPRNFERIKQMVEALDYARPQVMVEVVVAERSVTDETQLGMEWSLMTTGSLFGNLITTVATTSFNLGSITQGLKYSVSHDNITGLLQALKQNNKLNILSTPRILTSDNNAATIKVGERVPFLTSRQVTDTGSVFNSFSYQDVGITLTVTPHINPDGYVSMNLHPIISKIENITYFDAPVIANREATTEVMVKDSETVIIGGLMSNDLTESENKVPILGDIPILKYLFSSKDSKREKTELMIFLTPHVVHNVEELRLLSAQDNAKLVEMQKKETKQDKKEKKK